jgi:prevent-host-death family protein
MLDAKNNLSRLVEAVESGSESEIIIARNGRPAARLVPLETKRRGIIPGIAKGLFVAPRTIDEDAEEIAKLFNGDE